MTRMKPEERDIIFIQQFHGFEKKIFILLDIPSLYISCINGYLTQAVSP
jgi:hypothetical protein